MNNNNNNNNNVTVPRYDADWPRNTTLSRFTYLAPRTSVCCALLDCLQLINGGASIRFFTEKGHHPRIHARTSWFLLFLQSIDFPVNSTFSGEDAQN